MTEPPPNTLQTRESQPNRYHLFPAWLSLICPGLGQLVQGRVSAFFGHFTLWLLCLPGLAGMILAFCFTNAPELIIPFGIITCLFITTILFSVVDTTVWQEGNESYLKKHLCSLAWISVSANLFFDLFFILPALQAPRGPHPEVNCLNNIKNIELALLNYECVNNKFPPAYTVDENGKPLHSWRVLILPYLDGKSLYQKIRLDEPWDSEYNRQFHYSGPRVFKCPSWNRFPPEQTKNSGFLCNYSVVVGEETLFPGAKSIGGLDDLQDITNTIMLVERYTPNWMDPTQEISYETACKGINKDVFGVGSFHPGGTNVGFADGSVRFLENDEDLTPYLKAKKLK